MLPTALYKKALRRVVVVLTLVLVPLQFVRPRLQNPPVTADFDAPPAVTTILRTSCYACHSNETHLSWFDQIVPAYQLVLQDVSKGRQVLNFSDLGEQPWPQQKAILFEAVSQIQMGAMPLARYTSLHPAAAVTPEQAAVLRNYLLTMESRPKALQPDEDASTAQYLAWINSPARTLPVQPAPNGIAFPLDYKNWKAISSTDRTDTNTLKMILGNNVAIQAIADQRINPWPDGTTFAKVSWGRQRDDQGVVRTGRFEQVAFMIKDRRRYSSTAGWGWAQWMGTELTPYGTDGGFARQCVACHAPLSSNDYVFTAPIAAGATK